MGNFNLTITNEGAAFLANVIANQGSIDFTEVRFSSTNYVGSEATLTEGTFGGTFITAVPSASVADLTTINVESSFDNSTFTTDKTLYSIGVIAEDGDSNVALVAVCTTSTPDTIPKLASIASEFAYNINMTVSSTQNITVTASGAGVVFVTDIIDNLTSSNTNKPLSAKQGKVLQDNKQPKTLETPLTIAGTTETTVEGALGALKDNIGVGSNPNLFDNPWFNVNQREFTSGIGTANLPIVDRWQASYGGSPATYTVSTSGIAITNITGGGILYQKMENPAKLDGKTVTMSVMFSDGTIIAGTVNSFDHTAQNTFYDVGDCALASYPSGSFNVTVRSAKTIRAVKLELGSMSTISLDIAPDYTTELLKCQRYYVRKSCSTAGRTWGYVAVANTSSGIFLMPLAVPLREGATITSNVSGSFILREGTTEYPVTSIASSGNLVTQQYSFGVISSSTLTAGASLVLINSSASAYIEISAEL